MYMDGHFLQEYPISNYDDDLPLNSMYTVTYLFTADELSVCVF